MCVFLCVRVYIKPTNSWESRSVLVQVLPASLRSKRSRSLGRAGGTATLRDPRANRRRLRHMDSSSLCIFFQSFLPCLRLRPPSFPPTHPASSTPRASISLHSSSSVSLLSPPFASTSSGLPVDGNLPWIKPISKYIKGWAPLDPAPPALPASRPIKHFSLLLIPNHNSSLNPLTLTCCFPKVPFVTIYVSCAPALPPFLTFLYRVFIMEMNGQYPAVRARKGYLRPLNTVPFVMRIPRLLNIIS